ncbi:MAG: hypothetical protein ABIM99_04260 [Candidatus Dojkabacteria bacterium]
MKKKLTYISIPFLIALILIILWLIVNKNLDKINISETLVYIKDNNIYKRTNDWTNQEILYTSKQSEQLSKLKANGNFIAFRNGTNLSILNSKNLDIKIIDSNPDDFSWIDSKSQLSFISNNNLNIYSNAGESISSQSLTDINGISSLISKVYSLKTSFDGSYIQINNKVVDLKNKKILNGQYSLNSIWSSNQNQFIDALSLQDMGGLFEYSLDNGNVTTYKFPDSIALNSDSAIYETNSNNIYYILFNTIKLVDTSKGEVINTIKYDSLNSYLDLKFQSKGNKSFVATESIGDSTYRVMNLTLDGKIKDTTFEANEVTWLE